MKTSLATVTNLADDTSHKDGQDDTSLDRVVIDVAQNGYLLSLIYDDGSELKTVYENFDLLLKDLRSAH